MGLIKEKLRKREGFPLIEKIFGKNRISAIKTTKIKGERVGDKTTLIDRTPKNDGPRVSANIQFAEEK